MKILRLIVLMAVFILLPTLSYPATLGHLRISFIEGDVQINTEDTGDWVPASLNMPLKDGDRIWVPEGSRTELQLRNGSVLRLDEKTALDVLTLEKDSYQFYLSEGRAYANLKGVRGSLLQIDTPLSSVSAYERAIFRIDILNDRHTDISVYQGSVDVESNEGRIKVDQNRTLALREGFPAEFNPLAPPDEWERWNQNRNRIYVDRRSPSRYLPEELYPYATDFEDYGRWVYVRGYGYVWTPTAIVSAGWAPYRMGRWVWIRGDYVWISYEPWGWVPYHYGRWAFVSSIGWCWVPPSRGAVYWGPGFVGWVRTPTHISWVPLAPREIFYGYGYYGPYSVNLIHTNIATINVGKVVYRNVHVHNAVTVVHHDTFVHGRHVEVRERENPFLREKIHIGRPNITPERTTVMPVVREIPQVKKPSEKIREINVREIKGSRPLTREREAPVLKPASPPKETTIKSKEPPPVEKKVDRIGEKPSTKELDKGKEFKTPVKEVEKPTSQKPMEKVVKPAEVKPTEKGMEPSKVQKPSPERTEKQPVVKPQEKIIEKPKEKTTQPTIQRPVEDQKPKEPGVEKSRERSTPDRSSSPVREKEIQKPPEQKPIGGERVIQKEVKPERAVEKPQETKPPVREIDKSKQPHPSPSQSIRPPDASQSRPTPPPRIEQRPEPRVERPQETKPPAREIDRPSQTSPPSQSVRPPDTSQGRVAPPPRVEQRPEPHVERPRENKSSGRESDRQEGVKPQNGGPGRETPPPGKDRKP
ncbi:MAG: hypothetical protein FJ115_02485 [Deltaproteobacteria bacterium]|nr:hypothetical protein [Deltaproteobacteria bacterium]